MRRASTFVFVISGVVAVFFIAAPIVGLHISYGIISGVVGSGIICGMVLRARADPAYDHQRSQADDESPDE